MSIITNSEAFACMIFEASFSSITGGGWDWHCYRRECWPSQSPLFSSHYLSSRKLSPSWEGCPSQSSPSPSLPHPLSLHQHLSKLRPTWLKCNLPTYPRYPIICKHTTVSQNMTVKVILSCLSGLYWPLDPTNPMLKSGFMLGNISMSSIQPWSLSQWHCSPLSHCFCLFILQCPAHLILAAEQPPLCWYRTPVLLLEILPCCVEHTWVTNTIATIATSQ